MTRDKWVKAMREKNRQANGFARLALADSIAELAAENAHVLRKP
jgi:hypothetical protein